MGHRLFVAIDLPKRVRNDLIHLRSFGMPGIKWVDPGQYHLSLRFIGEVDSPRVDTIQTALVKVREKEFQLRLKGVGTFPSNRSPKVLWSGVEKNETLLSLKRKVDYRLSSAGIPPEGRKYAPHVTLGRVKSRKIKRMSDYVVCYDLFASDWFSVTEFSLFSSLLTPKGAVYKKEMSYQLEE